MFPTNATLQLLAEAPSRSTEHSAWLAKMDELGSQIAIRKLVRIVARVLERLQYSIVQYLAAHKSGQ